MIFSQPGFCLLSKANVSVVVLLFLFMSLIVALPDPAGCQDFSETAPFNFSREDDAFLEKVQKQAFRYFTDCVNPENGLVMDKAINSKSVASEVNFNYSPATIAGVGFALTLYPIGVERGWITRDKALSLTLAALRFFKDEMQQKNGFFYHFVDMKTGKRAMKCEISSIDTALFIAGALFASEYYANEEVTEIATSLYKKIDWNWMRNDKQFLSMGWTPEEGFIPSSWNHYSEGILLGILALGSPTHPVPTNSWDFRRTWGDYDGHTYLINPPLFTHQFPQVWLDLRNRHDNYADYYQSSVQATLANRSFCIDLKPSFKTFSENRWGLTACIGPNSYQAYGAPPNPAIVDGTVAPAAAACSIVFTPELSLKALREYYQGTDFSEKVKSGMVGRFGLSDSFNMDKDYVADEAFAINQGPMILMIENARSGFVWKHFMKIPFIIEGMKKAGFRDAHFTDYPPPDTTVYRTAAYMPHQRPVYEANQVADDFSISAAGFKDSRWQNAPSLTLDKDYAQMIVKAPKTMDYELNWRMLQNNNSIFFRFVVSDSDLHSSNPDKSMYLDDSIEIYINTRNEAFCWQGNNSYQIILSPDATGNQLRGKEFMHGGKLNNALKWKYQKTTSGYMAMIEIPRSEFELEGVEEFAATVAAHDINSSKTADVKYNWFITLPTMQLGEIKQVGADGAHE
ncbi:MAG: glucoamylase family protein [Candidatus Rifleibacteriota bacterium]